jgi:hypothetical protein
MKTSQFAEVNTAGRMTGMRNNQNPSISTNRSAGTKLGMPRIPLPKMPLPHMPMEWLDSGSWRLPSGKALAEFALQAGFLAPLLFRAQRLGRNQADTPPALGGASEARSKPLGKGGSQ